MLTATEKLRASFSAAGEQFQANRKISFSLKPAVQRQQRRENKTLFAAKKVFPVFLALLGRWVRGIETPELLVLLVTKEQGNYDPVEFLANLADHLLLLKEISSIIHRAYMQIKV